VLITCENITGECDSRARYTLTPTKHGRHHPGNGAAAWSQLALVFSHTFRGGGAIISCGCCHGTRLLFSRSTRNRFAFLVYVSDVPTRKPTTKVNCAGKCENVVWVYAFISYVPVHTSTACSISRCSCIRTWDARSTVLMPMVVLAGWPGSESFQTDSGAQPPSYLVGTGSSFPWGKATGAWSCPIPSCCAAVKKCALIHPLSIFLKGKETTLHFTFYTLSLSEWRVIWLLLSYIPDIIGWIYSLEYGKWQVFRDFF
jgi:hypothetical protein